MTSSPSSIELTHSSETAFVKSLQSLFPAQEIEQALGDSKYFKYQNDPTGFGVEVLGETFTPDIIKMMESVRDHTITIAKSGNATGKTFGAARVCTWWYKCFPSSQVYSAAAPPEANLKKLLWGEIGTITERHPALFANDDVTSLLIKRAAQSFMTGVTVPTSGTEATREAKFCTDASELFELTTGEMVTYGSLIGKSVDVVSVNADFIKEPATAEFFDNGTQPVYRIVLSSGARFIRTGEHPFYVGEVRQDFKTHGGKHVKGRYRVQNEGWAKVKDIKAGEVVLLPADTAFNFGTLSMDANEIKVLAYLIGDGYIGDGSSIQFIQEDNNQLVEFKSAARALGSIVKVNSLKGYSWRVNGDGSKKRGHNPVRNLLIEHGISGDKSATKHIPAKIFQLKQEDISLFLSRLFSTDGWACVCKTGKYKKAEIGYVSKSERLARDIQRLLFRFGVASTIREQRKSWVHKGVKKYDFYWICTISRSDDVLKFARQIGIYGKEDAITRCIEFSANIKEPKATWRRSWHDGFSWDRVKSIELIEGRPTVGVHVPKNNTYLTNLVEHNSGKHAPNLLFVLDEGDAIPDEVYKGIESCMSGGNVRLLIMFNPRARQGEPYRMERDSRAHIVPMSAFNHPNVMSGKDVIPGAVTAAVTVRRINKWCRPLLKAEIPDENDKSYFQLPKFLEDVTSNREDGTEYPPLKKGWYKVMEPAFSTMVLGEYPSQTSNSLISREWVNRARMRWEAYVADFGEVPPANTFPTLGGDVAGEGGDLNIACLRYGGWVPKLEEWSGVDPFVSGERFIEVYKRKRCVGAFIDATGLGAGVAPHMLRYGCMAAGVTVSNKPTRTTELGAFKIMRDQLAWLLREWLKNDPFAMLPPDEYLEEELLIFTYTTDSGKVEVMKTDVVREKLKRSPDRFMALAMTFAEGIGAEPEKRPLSVETGPKIDRKRILRV